MRPLEEITVEDSSALQNTLPPSTHRKVMARMAASTFPASYRESGSGWDSSSLGRGWKQTGFLGGLTIRAVSGFSQSSMQMKTAAIKMVSCATTASARKVSCISEATEAITILVQVSQHVSVLTYACRGAREGDAKWQWDWGHKKTLKNSILSNAESWDGKSTDSGQHNGKWNSCHWIIPSGGKKIL